SLGVKSAQAIPAEYQSCEVSSTCMIGEFLYDDEYAPDATATCTLTSRYPDETVFLNAEVMTAETDGWYHYDATIGTTQGVYRSQICCTSALGVDDYYLCLDKTFEVVAASSSLTASQVWSYSDRTLSGFGNLVGDIWDHSTRSLSTFGTLVGDIWGNATRALTSASLSSGSLATKADVDSVASTVNSNRVNLEKLVNQPIIKTYIEEGEEQDLSLKIEQTKKIANEIYSDVQYLKAKGAVLGTQWSDLSVEQMMEEVKSINDTIGLGVSDSEAGSILGRSRWLKKYWGNLVNSDELVEESEAMLASGQSLVTKLSLNSKSSSAKAELRSFLVRLKDLEVEVGNTSHDSSKVTLFGKVKQIEEMVEVWDGQSSDLASLLKDWKNLDSQVIDKRIGSLRNEVISSSRLPETLAMLEPKEAGEKYSEKNKVLALLAVVDTNKRLLAQAAGKTVSNIWLEEGSIIFRAVVINPSQIISQLVPLKYYLPGEIKEEDIMKMSSGLEVEYDAHEDALFVSGEFEVAAGATETFMVEVEDNWSIAEEEIESLRHQAEELIKPLRKTAYFGQGATLKSDIDVSLDKIWVDQELAITPENRIRAYREAQIELMAVHDRLDKLKDLVADAGSVGSIFGFIGGVQAIAVWGLVIIMLTGFVFLVLYMKTISKPKSGDVVKPKMAMMKLDPTKEKKPKAKQVKPVRKTEPGKWGKFLIILFSSAAISAFTSGALIKKISSQPKPVEAVEEVKEEEIVAEEVEEKVLGVEVAEDLDKVIEEVEEVEDSQDLQGVALKVKVVVPTGDAVLVLKEPGLRSREIGKIWKSQSVELLNETEYWVKVVGEDKAGKEIIGWVNKEFVKE
ncbi:hypothetical protein ACFL18_02845, partial [Patescibacteria group bacterium]